jgi:small subunit ribosomal protein S11
MVENLESKDASLAETPEKLADKPKESVQDILNEGEATDVKIRRAKNSKNISHGFCSILATFNNMLVCVTDLQGNVISRSSSGKCNFRGSRKSTAYAAQVVTQEAGRVAISHGLKEVEIKVKGPGMGRDAAIRAVHSLGLTINTIADLTPIPHNGCRLRKRR